MPLDVTYGQIRNMAVRDLPTQLAAIGIEGTLYLGYPVMPTSEETISVDALLITDDLRLVTFLVPIIGGVPVWEELATDQDRLYNAMTASLIRHVELNPRRGLGVPVNVVSLVPPDLDPPDLGEDYIFSHMDDLGAVIENRCHPFLPALERPLQAALQRVLTMKPPKRRANVTRPTSRGGHLIEIEKEIVNLDRWQRDAAIECPEAPQRIRGLAGSGKTVVLAFKAAYLHTMNQDWNIAVTFFSRALYQQFRELIRRFAFEHMDTEPDWDKLQVLHAWGSHQHRGLYAMMCEAAGLVPRDFAYARATYGTRGAFAGICRELLTAVETSPPAEGLFDAVLIDEAQDLPSDFFRLIHAFTKEPKRIVWAYDELQNLSESSMPSLEDLFGTDQDGQPRVRIENRPGQPKQEIMLPVCYRNTPWALTIAHALGFGVHREEGIVQHFDDPALWEEAGYERTAGSLTSGQEVTLQRRADSFPPFFAEHLDRADAVVTWTFPDEAAQFEAVAASIVGDINDEELQPDDILVVLPDPLTAKRRASKLMDALARRGLESHLVGVTGAQDAVFVKGAITIAHIHRAKGNEAPMVYVLDAQACRNGYELIRLRNTLFTAITRSRAWVRICGVGAEMEALIAEVDRVRNDGYAISFRIPTPEQLSHLKRIHRERSEGERRQLAAVQGTLEEFLKQVRMGDISPRALPPGLSDILKDLGEVLDDNADDQ